jgi:uncharacterized protein YbaP (TraB family)
MIDSGQRFWRKPVQRLAFALAIVAPGLVCAQTQTQTQTQTSTPIPAAAPDESAVVQQLEVIGRRPGPALWRVTRGESEVVILGGLSPLPHILHWDTIRVEHALADATVLFLPPNKVHVSLFDAAGMFLRQGALKPAHGADMERALPPELRARFDRVRDSLHLDPKRYQHWRPAVAGLLLLGDYRRAAGLSEDKPGTTVAKLARAAHAEVRVVGELKVKPLFDAAAKMSDGQNQACLAAALDDVEREIGHAQRAADAWAVGDLQTVRANSSASLIDSCLLQLPGVQSVVEQGTKDAVLTINAALNRPGHSVAVIDLTFLLRRNGVLDRLKAEGDQVTVPAE